MIRAGVNMSEAGFRGAKLPGSRSLGTFPQGYPALSQVSAVAEGFGMIFSHSHDLGRKSAPC